MQASVRANRSVVASGTKYHGVGIIPPGLDMFAHGQVRSTSNGRLDILALSNELEVVSQQFVQQIDSSMQKIPDNTRVYFICGGKESGKTSAINYYLGCNPQEKLIGIGRNKKVVAHFPEMRVPCDILPIVYASDRKVAFCDCCAIDSSNLDIDSTIKTLAMRYMLDLLRQKQCAIHVLLAIDGDRFGCNVRLDLSQEDAWLRKIFGEQYPSTCTGSVMFMITKIAQSDLATISEALQSVIDDGANAAATNIAKLMQSDNGKHMMICDLFANSSTQRFQDCDVLNRLESLSISAQNEIANLSDTTNPNGIVAQLKSAWLVNYEILIRNLNNKYTLTNSQDWRTIVAYIKDAVSMINMMARDETSTVDKLHGLLKIIFPGIEDVEISTQYAEILAGARIIDRVGDISDSSDFTNRMCTFCYDLLKMALSKLVEAISSSCTKVSAMFGDKLKLGAFTADDFIKLLVLLDGFINQFPIADLEDIDNIDGYTFEFKLLELFNSYQELDKLSHLVVEKQFKELCVLMLSSIRETSKSIKTIVVATIDDIKQYARVLLVAAKRKKECYDRSQKIYEYCQGVFQQYTTLPDAIISELSNGMQDCLDEIARKNLELLTAIINAHKCAEFANYKLPLEHSMQRQMVEQCLSTLKMHNTYKQQLGNKLSLTLDIEVKLTDIKRWAVTQADTLMQNMRSSKDDDFNRAMSYRNIAELYFYAGSVELAKSVITQSIQLFDAALSAADDKYQLAETDDSFLLMGQIDAEYKATFSICANIVVNESSSRDGSRVTDLLNAADYIHGCIDLDDTLSFQRCLDYAKQIVERMPETIIRSKLWIKVAKTHYKASQPKYAIECCRNAICQIERDSGYITRISQFAEDCQNKLAFYLTEYAEGCLKLEEECEDTDALYFEVGKSYFEAANLCKQFGKFDIAKDNYTKAKEYFDQIIGVDNVRWLSEKCLNHISLETDITSAQQLVNKSNEIEHAAGTDNALLIREAIRLYTRVSETAVTIGDYVLAVANLRNARQQLDRLDPRDSVLSIKNEKIELDLKIAECCVKVIESQIKGITVGLVPNEVIPGVYEQVDAWLSADDSILYLKDSEGRSRSLNISKEWPELHQEFLTKNVNISKIHVLQSFLSNPENNAESKGLYNRVERIKLHYAIAEEIRMNLKHYRRVVDIRIATALSLMKLQRFSDAEELLSTEQEKINWLRLPMQLHNHGARGFVAAMADDEWYKITTPDCVKAEEAKMFLAQATLKLELFKYNCRNGEFTQAKNIIEVLVRLCNDIEKQYGETQQVILDRQQVLLEITQEIGRLRNDIMKCIECVVNDCRNRCNNGTLEKNLCSHLSLAVLAWSIYSELGLQSRIVAEYFKAILLFLYPADDLQIRTRYKTLMARYNQQERQKVLLEIIKFLRTSIEYGREYDNIEVHKYGVENYELVVLYFKENSAVLGAHITDELNNFCIQQPSRDNRLHDMSNYYLKEYRLRLFILNTLIDGVMGDSNRAIGGQQTLKTSLITSIYKLVGHYRTQLATNLRYRVKIQRFELSMVSGLRKYGAINPTGSASRVPLVRGIQKLAGIPIIGRRDFTADDFKDVDVIIVPHNGIFYLHKDTGIVAKLGENCRVKKMLVQPSVQDFSRYNVNLIVYRGNGIYYLDGAGVLQDLRNLVLHETPINETVNSVLNDIVQDEQNQDEVYIEEKLGDQIITDYLRAKSLRFLLNDDIHTDLVNIVDRSGNEEDIQKILNIHDAYLREHGLCPKANIFDINSLADRDKKVVLQAFVTIWIKEMLDIQRHLSIPEVIQFEIAILTKLLTLLQDSINVIIDINEIVEELTAAIAKLNASRNNGQVISLDDQLQNQRYEKLCTYFQGLTTFLKNYNH